MLYCASKLELMYHIHCLFITCFLDLIHQCNYPVIMMEIRMFMLLLEYIVVTDLLKWGLGDFQSGLLAFWPDSMFFEDVYIYFITIYLLSVMVYGIF